MINFHPFCPANTPNSCPAPQFPFWETDNTAALVANPNPLPTPTDALGAVASSIGLLFLQQPQVFVSPLQQIQQQLGKYVNDLFSKRKKPKDGVLLIEACHDANNPTPHGKAVQQVFKDTLAKYQSPTAPKKQPAQILCVNKGVTFQIQTPQDYLQKILDLQFTNFLSSISQIIARQGADGHDVISISAGASRVHSYIDLQKALMFEPDWFAPLIGLHPNDIRALQKQEQQGRFNARLLNKVNSAIVRYVDTWLDRPDSAYNRFKTQYRQVIKDAVKRDIAVVVAVGNEHSHVQSFRAKPGADANFLLEADGVIGVGASDDKRTATFQDDTIAPFSSWGNGKHNPMILAPGIGIKVGGGKLLDGSSVSAPQVAAVIRAMRQRHPNLTVEEIVEILQQKAVKTKDHKTISHGAGVMDPKAAIQEAEQRGQQFALPD